MTYNVSAGAMFSLAVSLVACSQGKVAGSAPNDTSASLSAWTPADATSVTEQWGDLLEDPTLVAACFFKISDDFIVPALTIRTKRLEDNRIVLSGPSFHHEPHISGAVTGVSALGEGVQTLTIANGKMVEVSGPDGLPEIAVDTVTFVSTLDDSAHREFRDTVVLESSQDDVEWSESFSNCRVIHVNPAHD